MSYLQASPVQGAKGTSFVVVFLKPDGSPRPIDGSDSIDIHFKPPKGGAIVAAAQIRTDGLDGKALYVDHLGILAEFGCWKIWGIIKKGSTVFYSERGSFEVEAAPPAPEQRIISPSTVSVLAAPTVVVIV